MTKDPNEIGALWEKKMRNGGSFFSGSITLADGQKIPLVIWPNGYKKNAHHPDYIVKISDYTPPARGDRKETGDSGEFAGSTGSTVDDNCPF